MSRYRTFDVTFEFTKDGSYQRAINRAVIVVYGHSELAIQAELQRQYANYQAIVPIRIDER